MSNFNPEVNNFFKENPKVTVIGLFWAGYWRLTLCVFGVYLALALVVALLSR